jgi:hypothetical protein
MTISPAAFSSLIVKARARAYRLSKLRLDEVSTVDSAANPHARILIAKRHERNETMSNLETVLKANPAAGFMAIAKAGHQAVSNGEISEYAFGELQKQLATSMYPDEPSEGRALAKFFRSAAGRATLANRPQVGHAANAELMKREGLRPGEEDPPAERGGDDTEADGQSPYYAELMSMAEEHRRSQEGRGKSLQSAFAHVATEDDKGRKLLAADGAWHKNRHAR